MKLLLAGRSGRLGPGKGAGGRPEIGWTYDPSPPLAAAGSGSSMEA